MQFNKLRVSDVPFRLRAAVAAMLVYAFFGSPTPDSVLWPEIITGILLVVAVGLLNGIRSATAYHIFFPHSVKDFIYSCRSPAVSGIFFYLLFIPALSGFAGGVSGRDMIRDIIPLLFMFLPFLLAGLCAGNIPRAGELFLSASAVVGVAFSLRFLMLMDMPLWAIGADLGKDNMLYLSAEPCVLFAALYLPLRGVNNLLIGGKSRLLSIAAIFAGLTAVTVLAATLQRAGLFFVFAGWMFYAVSVGAKNIRRTVAMLAVSVVFVFVFRENLTGIVVMIVGKTSAVWDNARFDELGNVIDAVAGNWHTMLFGKGWGSLVYSPAAGHVWVRYTHMMVGYFLLKTGFIGLVLLFIYGMRFIGMLWRLIWTDAITAYAVGVPLFCAAAFTTGFKTLGFGLLLCIITAISSEKIKEKQCR